MFTRNPQRYLEARRRKGVPRVDLAQPRAGALPLDPIARMAAAPQVSVVDVWQLVVAPCFVAGMLLCFGATGVAARPFQIRDLFEGQRVEVRGRMKPDGFDAKDIVVKAESGSAVELKGALTRSAEGAALPAGEAFRDGKYSLLGVRLQPSPTMVVQGAADLSALLEGAAKGRWVKVIGKMHGNTLEANVIVLREETEGKEEVEGPIERVTFGKDGSAKLEIGDLEIEADDDTEIEVDAEEFAANPSGPVMSIDDDDARPRTLRLFSDRVELGGQVGGRLDPESEFDLDAGRSEDETVGALDTQVEAAAFLTSSIDGFARVSLERIMGFEEPVGTDLDDTNFRVREANLTWTTRISSLRSRAAVRVGRQDFDEPREWVYDENLDAIRFFFNAPRKTRLEIAAATYLTADDPRNEERKYLFLVANTEIAKKTTLGVYGITKDEPKTFDDGGAGGDDARWFGTRLFADFVRGVDSWVDLGWMRGSAPARPHEGFGYDVGLTVEPLHAFGKRLGMGGFRPSFTLSYAAGTGDDPETGDIDEGYRQTGFDDNNASFAGVTSFRYYGEVLNPELNNLGILTLGFGIRPLEKTSVDVIFHRYEQDLPNDRIRGSNLVRVPAGDFPEIGDEIDVIVGMEQFNNVEVEFNFGVFRPGDAFEDPEAPNATRTSFQIRYNF